MELYQQNYFELLQLLPDLHNTTVPVKLIAVGHTDLHVMPDPNMTGEVYLLVETVGVLIYRDCLASRKVFCPELTAFGPLAKAELNNFLAHWLTKMIAEGRRHL